MKFGYLSFVTLLCASSQVADALSVPNILHKRWDYGTSDIASSLKSSTKNPKKSPPASSEPIKDGEEPPAPTLSPCSATQSLTNGFYDLSDLSSIDKESIVAWSAKGHDYNNNFTLGICSSPLKPNVEVNSNNGQQRLSINSSEVGAYYTAADGEKYSIGNFNQTPVFRGKKLTLTYTNGSYCPNGIDRKSTILSFQCDREILAKAQVSFVGVLHDCDYFFEVRTVHACATAHKSDDLAVIWIFLFIFLAALFVYCSGGFLYKRIVLNRRGWRQLPTYNLGNKMSSALSGGVSID